MSKTKSTNNTRQSPALSVRFADWFHNRVEGPANALVGGRARLRVIVLLAGTLALDSADKAMVGAVAVTLKQAMGIGNLQLALLIAAPTLMTALATLPFGALADRFNRSNLLAGCILVWAVLMVIGGAATNYFMLLLSRLVLGAAIGVVTPAVASLTGDFFQPGERGQIWGYILAGELAGVAVGYLVAGNIAAVLSWRASFWTLSAISLAFAPAIWRLLPEPTRGGQSWIPTGEGRVPAAGEGQVPGCDMSLASDADTEDVGGVVAEQRVAPYAPLVLREDPAAMSFRRAVRYILSIRTNVVLIAASALGYFFFGALLAFGVVFMRSRFGLGQMLATTLSVGLGVGAIIGVLISGRLADHLIRRGCIYARVMVAAAAFLLAAVLFLPALLLASVYIAAPLFFLAAIALGGANPPLDAARLDIMHFHLWGRAESVRAALRYLFQAIAPLVFAGLYILFSGGGHLFNVATGHIKGDGMPLAYTFVIMLAVLIAAGCIMLLAIRTYPRDVATARASEQNVG